MTWIPLNTPEQLAQIKASKDHSIIFKHSTRCSISLMVKKRFELDWEAIPESTPLYFLDLIAYRAISNQVADLFQVHHESPQVLLIKDGECVYETSHGEISSEELAVQILAAS
ncbi:bacillithiol system redox-active protein YtxJ [Hufsiella ginkgonis]|uniref:Bacillithiol system redox-active protein YtxJ n=1 Tax=Hufsiella ginkgonis TaxID=2695274 RepID=A0A7K1Y3Z9_9SPHI|nr:bacillithiol system redox-active protein YtxJ [Hufsiella ginkgonis]MXV17990.1 bacillithiol system redox-active protein YtxJ [Hufsiella ginkgonis]